NAPYLLAQRLPARRPRHQTAIQDLSPWLLAVRQLLPRAPEAAHLDLQPVLGRASPHEDAVEPDKDPLGTQKSGKRPLELLRDPLSLPQFLRQFLTCGRLRVFLLLALPGGPLGRPLYRLGADARNRQ